MAQAGTSTHWLQALQATEEQIMPLLSIQTNVHPSSENRAEMLSAISRTVAQLLGKSERYVMLTLTSNPDMLFGGASGPMAYLELKSIGLPDSRTAELSRVLCGLMQQHFGVPADRVYVEFASVARELWGWNEGTF